MFLRDLSPGTRWHFTLTLICIVIGCWKQSISKHHASHNAQRIWKQRDSLHIEPYCMYVAFYLLNCTGNKPGTISGGKYRQWVSYSSESCTLQIKYLQNQKGTMQGSSTPERTWKTSQHSPHRSKVSQKHKYKSTQVWSLRHIPFKLFLKRCWII